MHSAQEAMFPRCLHPSLEVRTWKPRYLLILARNDKTECMRLKMLSIDFLRLFVAGMHKNRENQSSVLQFLFLFPFVIRSQGYKIHVTKSVKPEPVHMKDILKCSGGTFLPKMPSSLKVPHSIEEASLDFSSGECRTKSYAVFLSFPV